MGRALGWRARRVSASVFESPPRCWVFLSGTVELYEITHMLLIPQHYYYKDKNKTYRQKEPLRGIRMCGFMFTLLHNTCSWPISVIIQFLSLQKKKIAIICFKLSFSSLYDEKITVNRQTLFFYIQYRAKIKDTTIYSVLFKLPQEICNDKCKK